ncbi:MAG: phosphotransferase family protein [Chloroflexota bacterium]
MLDLEGFGRVERATGGSDTTVWHLERSHRQYALRVFRPEQTGTLRRELVALGAASAGGVPVPRVFAAVTHTRRPALLMQWCQGRPLRDDLRERPGRVFGLARQFGRWQAAIHRLAAPVSLRTTWIDWAGPLEPGFAAHLAALAEPSRRQLLHLDYHPLNVLVHHGRVSAVLDWANAHAGDPRADFARTVTILRLSPPRGGSAERVGRLLLELGWRLGYGGPGAHMPSFYAWAGLAMQHDLAGRFGAAELAHVRRWTESWLRGLPSVAR